jgi:hypothetical protein
MQNPPRRGVWVTVPAEPDPRYYPPQPPPPLPQASRRPSQTRYIGHPAETDNPIDWTREQIANFQDQPYVGHPGTLESFIPVYGPGRDAAAYLQDGEYLSAGVSGLQAVLDGAELVTGTIAAGQAAKALRRGVPITRWTPTYNQTYRALRKAEIHGGRAAGEEAHHTIPLNGLSRSVADWRNNPAFIKVLKQEQHRRLHGRWGDEKQYNALLKAWYGTTGWMKAVGASGAASASRLIPEEPVERDDD